MNSSLWVRARGFTLLELLVVLMLIGLLVGLVSLSGDNRPRQARQEAEQLRQLLDHLREQAVLEDRDHGLRLDPDGYRVVRLDGQQWQAVSSTGHRLPSGLELRLELEGKPFHFGRDSTLRPQILVLSSDESTPFRLHIESVGHRWLTLVGDGFNETYEN